MPRSLTVSAEEVVTGLRIDQLAGDSPTLIVEGVLQDEQGRTLRSFTVSATAEELSVADRAAVRRVVVAARAMLSGAVDRELS